MAVSKNVVCYWGWTSKPLVHGSWEGRNVVRTRVDGAECETEKTVVVGVLNKLRANLGGKLDGLACNNDSSDHHIICVNVSA